MFSLLDTQEPDDTDEVFHRRQELRSRSLPSLWQSSIRFRISSDSRVHPVKYDEPLPLQHTR